MFAIHSIDGQLFRGSMEEIYKSQIPVLNPTLMRRHDHSAQASSEAGIHKVEPAAIAAYRQMLSIERGPIYHAFQIMQRDFITLRDKDSIGLAWSILNKSGARAIPVISGGYRLSGIITERSLLTARGFESPEPKDIMDKTVGDVMISPVISADPVTDIRRIARLMLDHDLDGVPIVTEERAMVGFIAIQDILRATVSDPPLSLWH
jgi:CBS domain-containing protein